MRTHSEEIRAVRPEDGARLLEIYEQYMDSPITFEIVTPTVEEFFQRITDISQDYPYIVYVSHGQILGYAYAHRHMERWCYQWNAELSVYLDRAAVGKGIGRRLYTTLMEILKLQNVKNVYGCVTAGNPASDRLHESMGFHRMGTFHKAGFKCGQWHDVHWYERSITEYEFIPRMLRSIKVIDQEKVENILAHALD